MSFLSSSLHQSSPWHLIGTNTTTRTLINIVQLNISYPLALLLLCSSSSSSFSSDDQQATTPHHLYIYLLTKCYRTLPAYSSSVIIDTTSEEHAFLYEVLVTSMLEHQPAPFTPEMLASLFFIHRYITKEGDSLSPEVNI